MNEAKKALLICLIATLFYLLFSSYLYISFGTPNNTNDFEFHWEAINGVLKTGYPMGYHTLFSLFSINKELFFGVNVFLICLVLPMLLFKLIKTWWVTVIYFATSLPHMWLFGATFPQSFIFLLIAIYLLNRKNCVVWLLCALLAITIHKQGLMIFLAILGAELVSLFVEKVKEKQFFPGVATIQGITFSLKELPSIILVHLPIPILYLGRGILKNTFLLVLAIVGLAMSCMDLRTISLTQLALILAASEGMLQTKHKKFFAFLLIIQILYVVSVFGIETIKTIVLNP